MCRCNPSREPELLQWNSNRQWVTLPSASRWPSTAALNRNQYWDQHHKFMKQMYLPLKFTMAFKAAPHRPGLKINITLMTPCNCLLNSSDKLTEWTEALNTVSLSLRWQLLCRDWKTCFSLSFLRKPFYPYVFTRFFFAWTWVTQSFLPSGLNWWQCRS